MRPPDGRWRENMDLHNWRAIAIAGVVALSAVLLAEPACAADSADRVVLTGHVLDALARATPDTAAAVEKSHATAPFAITIVMRRSDPAGVPELSARRLR